MPTTGFVISGTYLAADYRPLLHAEAGEILWRIGSDLDRGRHIRLATRPVAALEPGQTPSVERTRAVGIELQRGVVLVDRHRVVAELEVDEAARVARVGVVGQKLQRLVAIVQRLEQVLAAGAAAEATVVVGYGELGVEPDRLAVVGDRVIIP